MKIQLFSTPKGGGGASGAEGEYLLNGEERCGK